MSLPLPSPALSGMSGVFPPPPPKRIAVFCDGTWQNGLSESNTHGYTNILRLSRALRHHDDRSGIPICQVSAYFSGVGTAGAVSRLTGGAVGLGVAAKVEEAYSFISQNWLPGDEICLFGFSRGAYTARMVAGLIGQIGVLNRREMEAFPALFLALRKQGASPNDKKIARDTEELIRPYRHRMEHQMRSLPGGFFVKLVGVFDTVGSLGMPRSITHVASNLENLLGFSDNDLGTHIEVALHALALDEKRLDFEPTLWQQTGRGRAKGQVLKQVWFSGAHTDIGGGYTDAHDLADITLHWMASETSSLLSWDEDYLFSIPNPSAPYAQQPAHDSSKGLFSGHSKTRQPPTETDAITCQTIHSSVDQALSGRPATCLAITAISKNPSIITPLRDGLESRLREGWQWTKGEQRRPVPKELYKVCAEQFETEEDKAEHERSVHGVVGAAPVVVAPSAKGFWSSIFG